MTTCLVCARKQLTFLNYSLIWDVNTGVFYVLQQKEQAGMSVYNHNKRQGGPRWDGVQKFGVPPRLSWARYGEGNNGSCVEKEGEKGGRRFAGGGGFPLSRGILHPSQLFPRSQRKI